MQDAWQALHLQGTAREFKNWGISNIAILSNENSTSCSQRTAGDIQLAISYGHPVKDALAKCPARKTQHTPSSSF
jgi:hypothetical protein